jgi:hypothetical protein
MRSVTKKPPTTLIVAKTMAMNPRLVGIVKFGSPATKIAPIKAMPETALEPDMSGVWRVGGTLLITSAPARVARVKIKIAVIMAGDIEILAIASENVDISIRGNPGLS